MALLFLPWNAEISGVGGRVVYFVALTNIQPPLLIYASLISLHTHIEP